METGPPKDAEAAGMLGIRARGGAGSREHLAQSWQAASHHKRVNSEVCAEKSTRDAPRAPGLAQMQLVDGVTAVGQDTVPETGNASWHRFRGSLVHLHKDALISRELGGQRGSHGVCE